MEELVVYQNKKINHKCDSTQEIISKKESQNFIINMDEKFVRNKDKQILYKTLSFILPSPIIDIVIDYTSQTCDYYKCENLFLFKGIICQNCDSLYCSKQCYNCQKCCNCKSVTCQSCFIQCDRCGSYYCSNCMFKESDFYQIYYYCIDCHYGKDDMLINWENMDYNDWNSSD